MVRLSPCETQNTKEAVLSSASWLVSQWSSLAPSAVNPFAACFCISSSLRSLTTPHVVLHHLIVSPLVLVNVPDVSRSSFSTRSMMLSAASNGSLPPPQLFISVATRPGQKIPTCEAWETELVSEFELYSMCDTTSLANSPSISTSLANSPIPLSLQDHQQGPFQPCSLPLLRSDRHRGQVHLHQ